MNSKLFDSGNKKRYPNPIQAFLIITIALAFFEAVNMKLVEFITLSTIAETSIDVGLLTIEMIPTLFFFVYRPLVIHIGHRKKAEEDLIESKLKLEVRVQERTSELSQAYDTTIEGWSKALDLRDKETEGHSLRVTDLTLQLSSRMGVSKENMISIRWGALLHDIGKMGIADNILLKEGPLSDEEWKIMRLHPIYARDMLMPIKHLYKAIEIPYGHHEKWDGTGYPQGLKGDQIPLHARIFAVLDVWDALTNDRPYRLAWSREKAINHIMSESGKHFDPEVIRYFQEMKMFNQHNFAMSTESPLNQL